MVPPLARENHAVEDEAQLGDTLRRHGIGEANAQKRRDPDERALHAASHLRGRHDEMDPRVAVVDGQLDGYEPHVRQFGSACRPWRTAFAVAQ